MSDKTNLKEGEKISRDRKPMTCPSCNGKNVAVILWGLPYMTAELSKAVEENKIVFGGCCVSNDDPAWECADCYVKIWSDKN